MPTTDAWATLAGLARDTDRIRLGALVSPVTFRIPGSLAKVIQTVDEMSGGRVEAGFGAGWNEDEHAQLGIAFPPLGERYDMLAEELAIIHGLWTEADGWSFDGEHWQVRDAMRHGQVARNGRRHPHIILGGKGMPRLAELVARYADEFNLNSASPDDAPAAYGRVRDACRAIGRDPDELVYSAMTGVLVAETRRRPARRAWQTCWRRSGRPEPMATPGSPPVGAAGSWARPDEAHERVARPRAGRARSASCCRTSCRATSITIRLMGRVFRG